MGATSRSICLVFSSFRRTMFGEIATTSTPGGTAIIDAFRG